MKIAAIQIASVKGDIAKNIGHHAGFIRLASREDCQLIIFPELSLTGYEPALAKDLAAGIDDPRFDRLQQWSNTAHLTILAGMPIRKNNGQDLPQIGLIIFQPNQSRKLYCKQFLHEDEFPFFSPGNQYQYLNSGTEKAGLAICYEVFAAEHARHVAANGSHLYLASVAKSAAGMEKAMVRMPEIGRLFSLQTLVANAVGPADNFIAAGQTAAWRKDGSLAGMLDTKKEGILYFDTAEEKAELFYP